eukprot:458237-Pelagomonas_calceolata.AAC.7
MLKFIRRVGSADFHATTLQGADNVFTQHTPLLAATLSNFLMGQLDIQGYPFIGMSQVGSCGTLFNQSMAQGSIPAAYHSSSNIAWLEL